MTVEAVALSVIIIIKFICVVDINGTPKGQRDGLYKQLCPKYLRLPWFKFIEAWGLHCSINHEMYSQIGMLEKPILRAASE